MRAVHLQLRQITLSKSAEVTPRDDGCMYVAMDDPPPVRTILALRDADDAEATVQAVEVCEVIEVADPGHARVRGFVARIVELEHLRVHVQTGTEHLEDGVLPTTPPTAEPETARVSEAAPVGSIDESRASESQDSTAQDEASPDERAPAQHVRVEGTPPYGYSASQTTPTLQQSVMMGSPAPVVDPDDSGHIDTGETTRLEPSVLGQDDEPTRELSLEENRATRPKGGSIVSGEIRTGADRDDADRDDADRDDDR